MLLVIFGAGASYDSVPSHPPRSSTRFEYRDQPGLRPPLADDLFADRQVVAKWIGYFPDCEPIVPLLRYLESGMSLEQRMEQLQSEATEYPVRHRQLAAVRYYIQSMLSDTVRQWNESVARGVTNYKTLLDAIERWRGRHRVCLVTFNYDVMLENALQRLGVAVDRLDDYLNDAYSVIKIHGSVNWARVVTSEVDLTSRHPWDVINQLIQRAPDIQFGAEFRLLRDTPPFSIDHDGAVLFPAIAVPVAHKVDFELPHSHYEALEAELETIDKIVCIGWRATDEPFLRLLQTRAGQRREMPVLIVSGDKQQGEEVHKVLTGYLPHAQYTVFDGGFSELVVTRGVDGFLHDG